MNGPGRVIGLVTSADLISLLLDRAETDIIDRMGWAPPPFPRRRRTVENLAFVEHESYLCDPTHPLCPVQ